MIGREWSRDLNIGLWLVLGLSLPTLLPGHSPQQQPISTLRMLRSKKKVSRSSIKHAFWLTEEVNTILPRVSKKYKYKV